MTGSTDLPPCPFPASCGTGSGHQDHRRPAFDGVRYSGYAAGDDCADEVHGRCGADRGTRRENAAVGIVLGLPLNMDGSEGRGRSRRGHLRAISRRSRHSHRVLGRAAVDLGGGADDDRRGGAQARQAGRGRRQAGGELHPSRGRWTGCAARDACQAAAAGIIHLFRPRGLAAALPFRYPRRIFWDM